MYAALLTLCAATTSLAAGLWLFPIKRRPSKGAQPPAPLPRDLLSPTSKPDLGDATAYYDDDVRTETEGRSCVTCFPLLTSNSNTRKRDSVKGAVVATEAEFFATDWSDCPDMEVDTQPRTTKANKHPRRSTPPSAVQSQQHRRQQHHQPQRQEDGGEEDERMADAASSGSSDTSDPDWGVDWGGTVSSLPRNSLRHLPSPRTEEWPSLEPHSLHPTHQQPSSGGSKEEVARLQEEAGVVCTPPWPTALAEGAAVASPFASVAEECALRASVDDIQLGPGVEALGAVLVLSVVAGPVAGRQFRWDPSQRRDGGTMLRLPVGRHPNNALVLEDDEVSSYHAELKWEGGCGAGWTVRDRGSLNGTQLNGVVISEASRARGQRAPLSAGDVLQLGTRSRLRVTLQATLPPLAPKVNSSSHIDQALASLGCGGGGGLLGWKAPSGCVAASDVCASPPRPIRTRSQKDREEREAAVAAASASSPVGVPEERSAEWAALGVSVALTSVVGRQHRLKGQPSEDKAGWALPLSLSPLDDGWCALFGVYDGHGGVRAAEEVRRRLPDEVGSRLGALLASGTTLHSATAHALAVGGGGGGGGAVPPRAVGCGSVATASALTSAFLALDATLGCDEGCTATTVLLWHAQLGSDGGSVGGGGGGGGGSGGVYVQAANVGDSAALFVPLPAIAARHTRSAASAWVPFAGDHGRAGSLSSSLSPEVGEVVVDRWVAACGRGEVREGGGESGGGGGGAHWVPLTTDHRLVNPDEQRRLADIGVQVSRGRLYGLNLGRSLGDKCLKDADLGLLATPSVSPLVYVPPGCMGLVVIASDGLWDSISPEDAADIALRVASGGQLPGVQDDGSSGVPVPTRVARALLEVADRHKRTDDITVMVLAVDGAAR